MPFLPTNQRARAALLGLAAVALLLFTTQVLMPGPGAGHPRGTPIALLYQGFVTGIVTSLYAVGIVLIYRTMRVVNFAQGVVGGVGAQFAINLLVYTKVPFVPAFILCIAVAAFMGMLVGIFMLRFFNASRLFLTVVTIVGATTFIQLVFFEERLPFFPKFTLRTQDQLDNVAKPWQVFPFRGLRYRVGGFPLHYGFEHLFAIEVSILALLGVGVFLRYTRAGTAVRAMAENPERASLLGIGVAGLSVVVWTIAGTLDGAADFAARAGAPGVGGGLLALLIPFAGAVVARFQSLPVAIAVCVGLGMLRDAWQYSLGKDINLFYAGVFVFILVALLVQRRRFGRAELGADVGWAGTSEQRPVPAELRTITGIRLARWGFALAGIGVFVLFPFIVTAGRVQQGSTFFVYSIAVLSLVILTGWAGQVSLCQWALVAIGAAVAGALTHTVGLTFWLAIPLVSALTAGLAVIVGLPALRIKGLFLLVTTFVFAVVVAQVFFDKRYFGWLLPKSVERPTLFFLNFNDERSMYFLCLAGLIVALWVVTNLRRSRFGRVLIAMRDNEANVQSFGVSALRAKLVAFAAAGALCGVAGVLYAHVQRGVSGASFGGETSVLLFLAAVVGGISSPAGALLGALYYQFVDTFSGANNQVILHAFLTAGGPLLIVFMAPGGLISLANTVRDSVLRIVAQRRHIVVPSLFADYDPELVARQLIPLGAAETTMGLAALPLEDRFVLESTIYGSEEKTPQGIASKDGAALGAAARSLAELETS